MSDQELGNRIQELVETEYSSIQKAIEAENELLRILPRQKTPYRFSGQTTFSSIKKMILISFISTIIVLGIFIIFGTIYNYVLAFTKGVGVDFLSVLFILIFLFFSVIIILIISPKILEESKKEKNRSRLLVCTFNSLPWILIALFSIIGQFTDPVGFGLTTENLSIDNINIGEGNTMTINEHYRMMLFFLFFFCLFLIFAAWGIVDEWSLIPNFDEDKQEYYQIYQSQKLPIVLAPKLNNILTKLYYDKQFNQIANSNHYQNTEELQEIAKKSLEETKKDNFFYIVFYKFPENQSYQKGYIDIIINLQIQFYINQKNDKSSLITLLRYLSSRQNIKIEKNNESQSNKILYSIKWCYFSQEFTKANLENIYYYFKSILDKTNFSFFITEATYLKRENIFLRTVNKIDKLTPYIVVFLIIIMFIIII